MNRKQRQEWGRKGIKKRFASRYATLKELSGYGTKDWQNKIIKWPTKALEVLLEIIKSLK